jgi:flagellar protein FliS
LKREAILSNYNSQEALKQYRQLGLEAEVSNASPHRLIQLLFAGVLDRLAVAQGAMARGDIPLKGQQISKAIAIISGLRSSLDMDAPGDLPTNLDQLYEYMEVRLVQSSARNDLDALSEVTELLKTLKSGWDGIAPNPGVNP